MSESGSIKFLYGTAFGRFILKGLVNPGLSKAAAKYLTSPLSRWLVPIFVKNNNIDLSLYKVPVGGYNSFNDFFTRKIKEENMTIGNSELTSPCDGLLTISDIDENLIFHIKNTTYSVAELLDDRELAKDFYGGTALIFRLTPAHYHNYVFCTSGTLAKAKRIQGILHSVQPICHEKAQVFVQNSREYVVVDTPSFGNVIQMEVGALLVGKITNKPLLVGAEISKGMEKGNFEYGGSSIVVLTQKPVTVTEEILGRELEGTGLPVIIGENLI